MKTRRRTRAVVLILVPMLVAAACGDDDDKGIERATPQPTATVPGRDSSSSSTDSTADGSSTSTEGTTGSSATTGSPGTTPTSAAGTTQPPSTTAAPRSLDGIGIRLTRVVQAESLTAMAIRPGHPNVLFLAERGGRVRAVMDGRLAASSLVQVETTTDGERGLLGIAFSPDGSRLYVSHTDRNGNSRLAEYRMGSGPTAVDTSSRREVLFVEQPYSNHNGGGVTFGPDGFLYWGLGDGGSGGDPHNHGQNTNTLLGANLRIEPRQQGGDPYAIPSDNPFAGGGGRGEVYVYGVRNPWRTSFDRATGDMWIGDVGQSAIEEIDLLPAGRIRGANLGWARLEGTRPYSGTAPSGAVPPVHEYANESGTCGVIGGYVYRGSRIPDLRGVYLFGDLCEGLVRGLAVRDGRAVDERPLGPDVGGYQLVSFGQDAAGELYVLTLGGELFRVDPA